MDLFALNMNEVFSFLLSLMRISLVLFLLPFFGGQSLPAPVKAALCLVLTLALWPKLAFAGQAFPTSVWAIALMLLGEVTLGLVLGLVVNFLFAAIQTGGSLMGFQMGFTMVNAVDPMTGVQEPATSHFLYMVTLLTFLSLNGHLLLLQGLGHSFAAIPPGGLYLSAKLADQILAFSSQIFVMAVKIAAPVLASLLLVDLALAIITRVAPQMNVLTLGFPVKISVGFLFMGLIFTALSRFVGEFLARLEPAFELILKLASHH